MNVDLTRLAAVLSERLHQGLREAEEDRPESYYDAPVRYAARHPRSPFIAFDVLRRDRPLRLLAEALETYHA